MQPSRNVALGLAIKLLSTRPSLEELMQQQFDRIAKTGINAFNPPITGRADATPIPGILARLTGFLLRNWQTS